MKYGIILALIVVGIAFSTLYSYIFARRVEGEIVGVERVIQPTAIVSGGGAQIPNSQLFSFAVAIRQPDGEIVTASSEDRQWAVATKGQCARARYFPYPPWNLDKAGTFHDARLIKLEDCPASLGKDKGLPAMPDKAASPASPPGTTTIPVPSH